MSGKPASGFTIGMKSAFMVAKSGIHDGGISHDM